VRLDLFGGGHRIGRSSGPLAAFSGFSPRRGIPITITTEVLNVGV
jgi:hypothetical protein